MNRAKSYTESANSDPDLIERKVIMIRAKVILIKQKVNLIRLVLSLCQKI